MATAVKATAAGGEEVILTQAEIDARNAEEAKWEAGKTTRQWSTVRTERNTLLTDCDWRVLPDQPVSQPWMDYRQALRDITSQTDPFNIVWPVEPAR